MNRVFVELHRRLRELDMSQSELAEMIGISPQALSRRFTGRSPFTEPEMQKILSEIGKPEETLADLWPRRRDI